MYGYQYNGKGRGQIYSLFLSSTYKCNFLGADNKQ